MMYQREAISQTRDSTDRNDRSLGGRENSIRRGLLALTLAALATLVIIPAANAEPLPTDWKEDRAYLRLDPADGSWANERIEIAGSGARTWSGAKSHAWNAVPLGDEWITTLGCKAADGATCTGTDLPYLKGQVIVDAPSGPLILSLYSRSPGLTDDARGLLAWMQSLNYGTFRAFQ